MAKAATMYDEPELNEVEFEEDEGTEATNVASGFEIDDDIQIGARHRMTARQAKYPFDKLAPGQSFHVAATADMPKPASTLAGAVTNANKKWSVEHPTEVETVMLSTFEVDAEGKRVRSPEGGYIKTGEREVTRPVRVAERHFTIRSVGEDDKRGFGARVFRDL